jgi:hypothetical protein
MGCLIMRKALAAMAALSLAGCSFGDDLKVTKAEVAKFHERLNAGKCAEIYAAAGKDFTRSIKLPGWIEMCEAFRARLGNFKTAPAPGWSNQYNNGVHTMVLTYLSEFEKDKAEEQFILRLDSGKAAITGYHIQSEALKGDPAPVTNETVPAEDAPKEDET